MARSHPPTLLTLAKRALGETGIARGDLVLVAVSGGRDSMALLDVLARLRASLGIRLVAHGVDHGLRSEAQEELELARQVASERNVPFSITRVEVTPGGNLQARARTARYRALEAARIASGAAVMATGHHADDRAETVLLRLLRGSGPRGLYVLPPRAGEKIRPFVRATRKDIEGHVARHALPYADDPSNLSPRFLRTRVRHELMPLLVSINPQIVSHLNVLSDQLAPYASQSPPLPLPRPTIDALRALLDGRGDGGDIWLPRGLALRRSKAQVG